MKSRFIQPTHMGVGAASVIMIFVVLCLTALSVLSLTGARTSEKSAARRSDAVCAYYEAALSAQEFLAETSDMAKRGEIADGEIRKTEIAFGSSQTLTVEVEAANGGARIIRHSVGTVDTTLYDEQEYMLSTDMLSGGESEEMLFID